jgi:hypothetical protein
MGLVTGLIIAGSAAASAYAAHKQSSAAKKAAEQQAASANRAIDLQREMYQQGRQDLTPYMQGGNQGLTALTSLLGVAPPPGAAPPMGAPMAAPGFPGTRPMPPGAIPTGGAQPRPGGAPGMVLLRAPTGQQQAVPADQAAFYLARGATRV